MTTSHPIRFVAFALALFSPLTHSTRAQQPAARQPNIVFIMSDDKPYFHFSDVHNPLENTQFLAALASDGMCFN
jgi:hypothetical protein